MITRRVREDTKLLRFTSLRLQEIVAMQASVTTLHVSAVWAFDLHQLVFSVVFLLLIKYNVCGLRSIESFIEAFARWIIYFVSCCWKLAKLVIFVVLVTKLFFPNFRPFSILPRATKFLKRIACNRTLSYLNDFHYFLPFFFLFYSCKLIFLNKCESNKLN